MGPRCPGSDKDSDYLVEAVAIPPTSIYVDTTATRATCNDTTGGPTGTVVNQAFQGDSRFDAWANVFMAREEDALTFSQN